MPDPDPYCHHPELRGRIADPLASIFRTFQPASLDAGMQARGLPATWRYSDEQREQMRRSFLGTRRNADIWIFAYGSLMWDPGFHFAELRVGRIAGYARRFCLKDTLGGRGTAEQPGLMAALDQGPGCSGLVFRIPAALADAETEVIWRREAPAPAYLPVLAPVLTAAGPVEALTFVANHGSDLIFPHLTRAEQIHYLATGAGFLGSSRDYIENIASQCAALGIEDPDLTSLLADVRAFSPPACPPPA